MKQNPFSLYDFLGYLLPGAVFWFLALAVFQVPHEHILPAVQRTFLEVDGSWSAATILSAVVLCYLTGHLISFTSSLVIEKHLNIWLDYPSRWILRQPDDPAWRFYPLSISKFMSIKGRLRLLLLLIINLPIVILDLAMEVLVKVRTYYSRAEDEVVQKILEQQIARVHNLVYEVGSEPEYKRKTYHGSQVHFFLIAYHYALHNAPEHGPKMRNYIALYGLTRAMSWLFLMLSWAAVFQFAGLTFVDMVLPAILSYLFYLEFVKFYRRFSQEALLAMAITCTRD